MQALEPSLPRKKPITYGRGRRPQIGSQHAFHDLSSPKLLHNASRLQKPTYSPARSSQVSVDDERTVFDVPSSDGEPTPKRIIPNSKAPSVRSTQSPSPANKKMKNRAPNASNGLAQARVQFAANSKKRKRTDLKDGNVLPPNVEDIDKAIDLQFANDMLHFSAAPAVNHNKVEDESTLQSNEVKGTILQEKIVRDKPQAKLSRPQKRSTHKQQRIQKPVDKLLQEVPSNRSIMSPPRSLSPPGSFVEPSTPPSRTSRGETPNSEKKALSTPRQAQLWKSVLGDESDDLQDMSFGRLELSHHKNQGGPRVPQPRQRRRRLVDQLKESGPAVQHSEDDMDSTSSEASDEAATPAAHSLKKDDTFTTAVSSQNIGAKDGGSRVTYASQRSYLQDPETDMEALLQQPLEVEESPIQNSQPVASISTSREADIYDVLEGGDEGKPLRSVHELRAAGTSHRFAGDMDAILVDLAGVTGFSKKSLLSSKRTSWLELCTRFVEADFKSRFLQGGYDDQVFGLAKNESDSIISMATAVVALSILEDNGTSQTARHIYSLGVVETISLSLKNDQDIVSMSKDRASNMSKLAQASVKQIRSHLATSLVWKDMKPETISSKLISLKAIELVIRRLRESGEVEAVLDVSVLRLVLDVLDHSLEDIRNGTDPEKQYRACLVETVLSLLESSTVVPSCASDSLLWSEDYMTKLVSLLDIAFGLPVRNTTSIDQLALRLCLNLANNNARNSSFFARPAFIVKILSFISTTMASISNATDQASESPEVNNLILSLGAMINLAEWSDNVRQVVASSCSKILTNLLKTFVKSRKTVAEAESIEASRANVVFGYLAVLLANLCQNEDVRTIAKAHLPKNKMDVIVEAVEEFIGHNERADQEQGTEMWVAFTNRLQAVANSLKALGM